MGEARLVAEAAHLRLLFNKNLRRGEPYKYNGKHNSRDKNTFFKSAAGLVEAARLTAKNPRQAAASLLKEDEDDENDGDEDLEDSQHRELF